MKKFLKTFLSSLLTVLIIGQAASLSTLALTFQPNYVQFDNADIPQDAYGKNLFLFGSKNMTVSEKSTNRYIMKIVRTGDSSIPADVTLKFTDVSARYGENYTVKMYDGSSKPVQPEVGASMVDFLLNNSQSQEEETPMSQEELLNLAERSGGFDTLDSNGNVINSITLGDCDDENELDLENLEKAQTITSDDSSVIDDKFPGTELCINFAGGETEKYVVIIPKYSKKADGDCVVSMSLKNPSKEFALSEDTFTSYLTILDEDKVQKAVVSLENEGYIADGDSISVNVTRSGAINEMASVNICTVSESAEIGYDFQGMDATLYFPMGIESRTVEIPVRHNDENKELTFSVKLVNPVNCTIDKSCAIVTILPVAQGGNKASYLSSSSKYDTYLADRLQPSDFSCFGNAWNTDKYWFKYSCKGVDYDTWNGGTYNFDNPYLYDGIRINWEAFHDGWGSISYTYINTDNGHVYYSEDNEWDTKTDDVIFKKIYNKELWIGSLTSYFNGIQVNVKNLKPIYRTFNFNLVDADALTFEGVDSATAKTYTSSQFANYAETVKTVNTSVGGSFTVAAPQSQKEYARFAGLKFLDKDGNELYYAKNTDNARMVTVKVTKELLSALACKNLDYEKQDDGRYIGNITVKPVYEYIDSEITVKTSNIGSFAGELAVGDTAKTLKYHLGDRLVLSSVVSKPYEGKYVPDGVRFERRDAQGKLIENGSGQTDYNSEGKMTYTVDTPVVSLTPTFRENDNAIRVQVRKDDVDGGRFDTKSGIFMLGENRISSGDYYIYTVSAQSVHLDQLISLSAIPASSDNVSVWSLPGAECKYSGNFFYFAAAREKAANLITLSLSPAKTFSFSGTAYNADVNLSTGNSSLSPIIPADGVLVCIGDKNTMSDSEGKFAIDGVSGCVDTCVRLMIYNNNSYTFKDIKISKNVSDYDLGIVTTASNSTEGAYFTNVYCYQDERLITSTETLCMNGKKLSLFATVKDGNKYIVDGTERTENVTGVTFYVLDGTTHAVKTVIPAKKSEDGVWSATVNKFSPDNPEKYYYGDMIYVSMTTDRICGDVKDENGNIPENFLSTSYAMLSTGYQIVKDFDYKPQEFSMNIPVDAAQVFAAEMGTTGSNVKRSYASFPFIGEINTVLAVKGFLRGSSSYTGFDEDEPDDPETEMGGNSVLNVQFRFDVSFEELPYGGTRVNIGISATSGNDAWKNSMGYNPLDAKKLREGRVTSGDNTGELLIDTKKIKYKDAFSASFGNPRMSFTVLLGVYIDFGLIKTTDTTTGESTNIFEDEWVFLGIGGFLGGSVGVEFQWFTTVTIGPVPVPVYAGVGGSAGVKGYLGASKDPNAQLTKYSDLEDKDGNINIDAKSFNADILVNASVKGHAGIGLPDVIGCRVILGFKGSFAFSPFLKDYFKQLENRWGLGVDVTVGGQIDLVYTRIPVEGLSYPLYSAGFNEYFLWLKRSNKLVECTLAAIEENGSNFSASYIEKARVLTNKLIFDINNDMPLSEMQKDFNTLVNHVYNDSQRLISTNTYNMLYLETPYDVFLKSSSSRTNYDVIEHTDSKWVGDRYMIENAAFQEATTQLLVKDSYSQPTGKLIDIGNGCLLSVFLTDKSEKGEVTNPTAVYTVYNTETEEWSNPVVIQNDGTADYTPNVCDAGDSVLITWSSAKKTFNEYTSDCKLMQDFDIYSIIFDKKTQQLVGSPEQLTDDEFMDCKPSAIYDSETGNMAVYYLKNNAQSNNIADYITTESLVCYRLYDSESKSWVTDYYEEEYPDYTPEQRKELAEKYKGQRFLTSAVKGDMPISDISVCEGYNGLGVYAYTVDIDGDITTNTDAELYLRVYDFRSHKTYKPIRITNDSVSQAMPQLIRNNVPYIDYFESDEGKEVEGTTYLFWLENDNQIKYISVTDLIRNGINEDGTIKERGYTLNPVHINTELGNGNSGSVSSYQAMTDSKDNLYIIWNQTCIDSEDEDITKPASLEIFAAAQIHSDDIKTFNADSKTGGSIGDAWSAPYRLTTSKKCNDGIAGAVAENGKLYITHNRYSVKYIGDTEEYISANPVKADGSQKGNPYEISSTDFMFTSFEPVGSISAEEITLSDETPCAGDTVTVTAKIKNTGLTSADGYSLNFYESKKNRPGKKITSVNETKLLVANAYDEVSFEWTVPEDFDGMSIMCEAQENGYGNETVTQSEPITSKAVYEINIEKIKQDGDKFIAEYSVYNSGNADAAEGDVLEINFAGLYGDSETFYGLETPLLASVSMSDLKANSSKSFTTEFSVPESAFDYCGYDQALFTVKDSEGNDISDTFGEYIVLEKPMNVSFEDGDGLNIEVNESKKLNLNISSEFLKKRSSVVYSTEDPSVAKVDEEGNLIGVLAGETTVTAYIMPFGITVSMPVVITDKGHVHVWDKDFTVDKEPTCTEEGSKSIHCKECASKKDVTVIPATGHKWNDGKITKKATANEAGEKLYECIICGQTKTEEIPPKGSDKKTGDNSLIFLWILILALSAVSITAFAVYGMKRKKVKTNKYDLEETLMTKNDEKKIDKTVSGEKGNESKAMDIEDLKNVTGGGGFDEFPRVNDNDYDDDIKGRV